MYLFLDESGIDGKSDLVFVGGIYTKDIISGNFIRKTILKSIKKAPKINEYKYSDNIFSKKLKDKVIKNLKYKFVYVYHSKKSNSKNIKDILCELISNCLEKVSSGYKGKIFVIYDKNSLKITKNDIQKFLKLKIDFDFEMQDSKNSSGLQISDWIVGAAKEGLI